MKKLIITLILITSFSISSNAQLFTEQTDIEIQGIYLGSVAWGDYNKDGLMDFMMTGRTFFEGVQYPYSCIFKNMGNNNFIEFENIIKGAYYSSLEWSDYNNDNELDIGLSGLNIENGNTYIYSEVYKNSNVDFFSLQYEIILTPTGVGKFKWGDYDNNKNADILKHGLTEQGDIYTEIYQNKTNNIFVLQTNIIIEGIYYGDAEWIDYNNDGLLDFILSGNNGSDRSTKLYKNNGNSLFTEQVDIQIEGLSAVSMNWGDYNNDGYLDFIISGHYYDSSSHTMTCVYKNIEGESFEKLSTLNIENIDWGDNAWGDYNNDGLLDILLVGWDDNGNVLTKVYKNNGNEAFIEQTSIYLTPVGYSSVAWSDYDNDNDLDILLTGIYTSASVTSKIYKNNSTTPNIRPNVITNLETEIVGNDVIFSWDEGTDDNQPSAGLNYNIYVYEEADREHIISGDTVYDNMYVASPQAFPYHHELNGKRLFPKRSHIQGIRENGRVSYILKGIFEDCKTYYWSVQSVDASFAGGEFAPEATFVFDTVPPEIECSKDTTIMLSEGETEYFVSGGEFDPVSATDNCEIENLSNNYNLSETLQGEYLSVDLHSIEWIATDKAGMQTQCSFNVLINEFVDVTETSENEIKIYPNPATDKIIIDFKNSPFEGGEGGIFFEESEKNVIIKISNTIGQIVFNSQFSTNNSFLTIDLSNFNQGIYFIKFIENERIIQTTKLIIQ